MEKEKQWMTCSQRVRKKLDNVVYQEDEEMWF